MTEVQKHDSEFQLQVKQLLNKKSIVDEKVLKAEEKIALKLLALINNLLDGKWYMGGLSKDKEKRTETRLKAARTKQQSQLLKNLRKNCKSLEYDVCDAPSGFVPFEVIDMINRIMVKYGSEINLRIRDLLELDNVKTSFGYAKTYDITQSGQLVFKIEVY